jgi:hypothetical protein
MGTDQSTAEFVASKRKRKRPANIKPVETQPKIPKDLQDQWGAVEACGTAFNIMQKGTYTHEYLEAVRMSLAFLAKLHEQTVERALTHPEAALIPQLKEILDKKAAGNGEKTSD